MSNFNALYLGRNAIQAHRIAMDVASHNLANASVPGYSRQQANYADALANRTGQGFLGNGARIQNIGRKGDRILEARLDQDTSSFFESRARYDFLVQAEVVYSDESFGIGPGITSFFNGWRELSTNPASQVARSEVIARGEDMADRFNQASQRLEFLRRDLNGDISAIAETVTTLADSIATLNREIHDAESGSLVANDMRDQRQRLVREVSEMVRVQSFEDGDGLVHLVLDHGESLVSGRRSGSLRAEFDISGSGLFRVGYRDADQTASNDPKFADVTDTLSGGELGGMINARDNIVGVAFRRLDNLVTEFAAAVNRQHAAGFDRNANQGGDFFTFTNPAGSPAQEIVVNPALVADENLVAAAATAAGAPGDNRNALAMADLETQGIIAGETTHDAWSDEIRFLGDEANRSRRDLQRTEVRRDQTEAVRESLSGVSLDEELADLVRYQRAYEAAAKVITTADETIQTLLSLKQ